MGAVEELSNETKESERLHRADEVKECDKDGERGRE